MQRRLFIFLIGLIVAAPLRAQFNLQIGQSSDNTFTKGKDAEFQITDPADDAIQDSWLVNSYLETGYKFNDETMSVGLTGEIHRNTLVAKKQHVEQLGLSGVFSLSNSDASKIYGISLAAKYSNDK
ncbi:MAG TPA: hypothetical protein VEB86_13515, partial [Chryseosolibacter sp.]|nr:hypothetical protein [Chryseosolibacter sp.]